MPSYEYAWHECSRKIALLIRGGTVIAAQGCGRPQCGMGGCAGPG